MKPEHHPMPHRRKRRWARSIPLLVVCIAGGAGYGVYRIQPSSTVPVRAAEASRTARPTPPLPSSALIHVPPKSQLPELPNGCEVTSLSMLLKAVGHPMNKMVLAKAMPHDPTKEVIKNGQIVYWGNPNRGFVGSVYHHAYGFGIYHGPMTRFLNQLLPHRALDLTGRPISVILRMVADGTPVEMWTTAQFQPTTSWVTWDSPTGKVRATMDEHAVLLVGYNANSLFINNPLTGQQAEQVNRGLFLQAWKQLGSQALTVRSLPVPSP